MMPLCRFVVLDMGAKLVMMDDAIASAVQRGNWVYVYNAKGAQLCVVCAGDGMTGYTGSSVSIKRGNFVYIFDAKGRQTSVISAGR